MIEAPKAAVHDLGYRRYVGSRRPQSTRWRAVVKNSLRMSWQGFWRAKVWLLAALGVVVAIGFAMIMLLEKAKQLGLTRSPEVASRMQEILDTAMAQAFTFLPWAAFILTMTAVARTVSRDMGAGAFEFYFSRPVRSVDYVLGKLVAACVLVGAQLLLLPFLLALVRVGVDWDNISSNWLVIPQTLLIGALATLFFASVPLALSSLVRKPRNALVWWAVGWVLLSKMAAAAATSTDIRILYAFDIDGLILGATYGFYGTKEVAFRQIPSLGFSIVCLLGYFVIAVGVVFYRVRSIERAGLGGG